jgi:hypothetical protein
MCNDCNDWKEILKEDVSKRQPGQGYGTRNMERTVQDQGYSEASNWGYDTEIDEEILHEGVKCFYCDEDAEWKCLNGLRGGCHYEGDRYDGVQVCGANSSFASDEYPEGHKTFANERNNGHSWADIDNGMFSYDEQLGYKDPDKHNKD